MREVPVEELRASFDETSFSFSTTEQLVPLEGLIGQERAARAIEFGLRIRSDGYNIYVAGIPGTGRTTSVEVAVRKIAQQQPTPDDWCYVYNFSQPDSTRALRFPPGRAVRFRCDMEALVQELKLEIPRSFESKIYEEHRNAILKDFQKAKDRRFAQLEEEARQASFQIKQTPAGLIFLPLVEGRPLNDEDLQQLTDAAREDIKAKQEILYEKLTEALREMRETEKKSREALDALERDTAGYTIQPRVRELQEKYREFPGVVAFLSEVEKDMIEHVADFQEKREPEGLPGFRLQQQENPFVRYAVNVLVDNSRTRGAPVVKEINPTVYNLSGRIEYRPQLGSMFTDFTMLKPGALHRANGGYLILQILDVLRNYFAWETLKRTIRNREIVIEDLNEQFRLINTPTLRTEPIPADLKIILIGNPVLYYLLYAYDEDFRKLFKVRADFSTQMNRESSEIDGYAAFIAKLCRDEKLRHFDAAAVARVIEYASRVVEHKGKLTTRFIDIADVVRESDFWAGAAGASTVGAAHVRRALDEKVYRCNLIETRIGELIQEGTILVDTDGEAVGQVNGLSVLQMGDYSFGKPSRITARAYPGRGGVINIDREVKLSGTLHNKGFLILSGYLGEKYGMRSPLVFSASLCFEQMYDEIEGDSASSTELYALLSAISRVPLQQGIAVTGSVNQKGEIQPIGGVNQKIEGFYYTCKARGLTGRQGVLIPERNVRNLMLNDEVIEAVRAGRFHIWAVSTIDEGMQVLTGLPSGQRRPDGTYPDKTVNARVIRQLRKLAAIYARSQAARKSVRSSGGRASRADSGS